MVTKSVFNSKSNTQAINAQTIIEWLNEAGDIALSRWHQLEPNYKDDGTPVTAADYQIEHFLLERISRNFPQHKIITEETHTLTANHEFVWVIDPLDGTRAFASGLPIWGISVGIVRNAESYWGAFYMPALGKLYWGNSEGVFCNGQQIVRHQPIGFENQLAFLAVPSNAHIIYDVKFPRIRSFGSTAAHLLYVATGAAIGALTRCIEIWDIAGVLPILHQMGGALVYLSGKPFQISDLLNGETTAEPLVAAHTSVIEQVRNSILYKPQSN
jgi:myo-inositol-1(or 4)-monophosphatase